MIGYVVPATSPCCGAELEHVASGRPIAGTEARAVARCPSCGREFVLIVLLRPASLPGECGTQAAAQRHWRRGEPLDDACRRAHNATLAAWRDRRRSHELERA